MKKLILMLGATAMVAGANAVVFSDTIGDVNMPAGYFANNDIKSVTVTNDSSNVYFNIELAGSITSGFDWGKYAIMIDSAAGGYTGVNPTVWNRSIQMPAGMDHWIGAWVDGGGGHQVHNYTGVANNWNNPAGNEGVSLAGNNFTIAVGFAEIGVSMYSTFCFDVMSSGGGGNDSAWDLLSKSAINDGVDNNGVTGWQELTQSTSQVKYQVVPEPASMTALALGAVAALRRRKK